MKQAASAASFSSAKGKSGAQMNYQVKTSVALGPVALPAATPKPKAGVRPARADDIEQLLEMSRALHAEGSYRDIPIFEPKLRAFLTHAMTDAEHACLVYERRDGRLDGFMIGYVTAHFFSLEKSAWDLCLFVRPARRGSIVAHRLVAAFKAFAARADARTVYFGTVAGIDPARTRKFFTGVGMTEVGALYLQTLSKAAPATG
jgi:N-acetylglutamate synthase-like GNAT family acetyltransferase